MTALRWASVILFLALRLIALDSDPPPWLSWSTGLYTDEGFYTLDARHEALFGTPAPGNFHDRLLSPILSILQQGDFALFGVGLVQARLLSVLFGMLTIWVFWFGLRRAYSVQVADFGAFVLGVAPPFTLYNRTALQETPTVLWLVLAFALWAYAGSAEERRRSLLYGLAGCSLGVAVVSKSLAGLAGIALLAGLRSSPAPILAGRSKSSPLSNPAPQNWGGGAFLLFLSVYAVAWSLPHHVELLRMTTYYRVHQMQPHSLLGLWFNIRRGFIKGEHGVFPYLLATLPVPCLLAGWGIRRQVWTETDRFLAFWLAGGLLFCLISSYAPSRYYVLFLPALIGLAGRGFTELKRPLQFAAVVAFILTSAAWYGAAWGERSFSQREAGRDLTRILPAGSVVIGDFAPTICLGTSFAATTVQPGLANDDHPVERLHATQVLVVRNAHNWQEWWRGHYPAIIQPSHRLTSFEFGGSRHFIVDLYQVKVIK